MKLAGIEHHSSYEWNPESNHTHNLNFGTQTKEVNIRELDLSALPKPGSIDIVVGSPPCTQFSFSNRGGKGNIEDGLIDLYKFLSIVHYLKPKYWAMENVPRVSKIVKDLVLEHPDFKQFAPLISFNEVVSASDFGVPQKRKRMICGDFPFEDFLSFRESCPNYTLGHALSQLRKNVKKDLLYGWARGDITDHDMELPLDPEEERVNREAKTYHPVYNRMAFPDPEDRPARTVTSLCTRVSRESIVIEDNGVLRRLTVRERAVLMGFPVSFQFYGKSHSAKLKMIGNAIPPPLTFHIFNAMLGKGYRPLNSQSAYKHEMPKEKPPATLPPVPKQKFQPNRNFRMCVAGYRFGSGVRFELSNIKGEWRIRFFYGSSTRIHEALLNSELEKMIVELLPKKAFLRLPATLKRLTSQKIQGAWIGQGGVHPFKILDELGEMGSKIQRYLPQDKVLVEIIEQVLPGKINRSLLESPQKTVSGLILGLAFNSAITREEANADSI